MSQNRTQKKPIKSPRNEPTVERQTESRTADSEKTNDTLRTQIIKFKDLVSGLQEQTAELTRINET